MTTTPFEKRTKESRKAVKAINDALAAVKQLELHDNSFGGRTTDLLIQARNNIVRHYAGMGGL